MKGTKMVKEQLELLTYGTAERAGTADPIEGRLLGRDINGYKHLKGECKKDSSRLFSAVFSDRTKEKEHKLKHRNLSLGTESLFDCEHD